MKCLNTLFSRQVFIGGAVPSSEDVVKYKDLTARYTFFVGWMRKMGMVVIVITLNNVFLTLIVFGSNKYNFLFVS